ncbi:class I SAM-dependent methyltransferase [Halorientalis halophila]|uniref:class I SAM-dependent methyltransferase n=1 Tax=Halorientalis halophila TaxID=3108499 RepID=UPI00300B9531
MAEADWSVSSDAIVERPRRIRNHPLLSAVYDHHDALIGEHLPDGEFLEVAFGQYMHPEADVGLEAWPSNVRETDEPAIVGDARSLPVPDDSFDGIIGRRFLHHVPERDRHEIVRECERVLRPGGRLILLEGTPGLYRRVTKGMAFRLGVMDEDNDLYGHLSREELRDLLGQEFEIVADEPLGSPLMMACISESELSKYLFPVYERTQVVTWWTLIVGEVT